jgi:uncharacterized protein
MKNHSAVIWQLTDMKRGHDRQTIGLTNALSKLIALKTHIVSVESFRLSKLLRRGFSPIQGLPSPHLIIGAGHQCQNALIKAKKIVGGLSICLMKPSLPRNWFDLCIIPEHDKASPRQNTIETIGVLNPITPKVVSSLNTGVILIGGPSRHHSWDASDLLKQIRVIIEANPDVTWTITSSRRTPSDTAALIAADHQLFDKFCPIESVPLDWINNILESCGNIWVTADSVSMIFEALSTRAKVGIIRIPAKRLNRISSIASDLQKKGWICQNTSMTEIKRPYLNEAHRCAIAIVTRWPNLTTSNM